MKAFVLGAGGMLGRAMCEFLTRREVQHVALTRADFELGKDSPSALAASEGDIVVNCAAYTEVDRAETEREAAYGINAQAVQELGVSLRASGATLLHYSTDYVFSGQSDAPYALNEPRQPINVYGASKAQGEELLLASRADCLIVRTSWVFAPWGKNFALTMSSLLKTRDEVKVVHDQRGCPTYAPDLAERSWELLSLGERGLAHVTNRPAVSWYEFACAIQEAQGSRARIVPCTSAEFPRPAPRPAYSVLSNERTDGLLGPAPDFRDRLRDMLRPEAA
jgi:dTDP-4-dehydrorhamnose reductase